MKIANSADLLDLIKSRFSLPSDYAAAKLLGISRARASNYRNGKHDMDETLILQVENLLEYPAGSLLFEVQASRTKCPKAAKIFHETAQRIAAGMLCFMLVFPVFFESIASPAGHFFRSLDCILCKIQNQLIYTPFEIGIFPVLRVNKPFLMNLCKISRFLQQMITARKNRNDLWMIVP